MKKWHNVFNNQRSLSLHCLLFCSQPIAGNNRPFPVIQPTRDIWFQPPVFCRCWTALWTESTRDLRCVHACQHVYSRLIMTSKTGQGRLSASIKRCHSLFDLSIKQAVNYITFISVTPLLSYHNTRHLLVCCHCDWYARTPKSNVNLKTQCRATQFCYHKFKLCQKCKNLCDLSKCVTEGI